MQYLCLNYRRPAGTIFTIIIHGQYGFGGSESWLAAAPGGAAQLLHFADPGISSDRSH
jgi:hypothetical protein